MYTIVFEIIWVVQKEFFNLTPKRKCTIFFFFSENEQNVARRKKHLALPANVRLFSKMRKTLPKATRVSNLQKMEPRKKLSHFIRIRIKI